MTLDVIELLYRADCDWCGDTCYPGEIVYYNYRTKKIYHALPYECAEKAES